VLQCVAVCCRVLQCVGVDWVIRKDLLIITREYAFNRSKRSEYVHVFIQKKKDPLSIVQFLSKIMIRMLSIDNYMCAYIDIICVQI